MSAWNPQANKIFLDAIEIAALEGRNSFIDRACDGNTQLREQVDSLVAASQKAGDFLEKLQPAVAHVATLDLPPTERLGTQIGPYKLLEQIGDGGMGVVYMAEQKKPVRRLVALKIVKPGMDSRQVIARFDAERQALAMMEHPNIARIIDAGTTELGRPYFVMELVRGIPINEFCDQKRLTLRERLDLFLQVCQAVQHAHQKGIIHRDLKPTNVLVTLLDVVAVPKVIDFGIAKAFGPQLSDGTQVTAFAQFVGTPLYMSPEQAEMNQLGVDTRSDVYSLGVMLYELLTGTTPFDKEMLKKTNFEEFRRKLREEDPPRPSARISTLDARALSTVSEHRCTDPRRITTDIRGELDWIVMKALDKDRNRRYQSATALAEDIQRYLSDEPVLACPPSTSYRFRKFAHKNRVTLTTAAIVIASLSIGIVLSGWQAMRAMRAETVAIDRLVEVELQRDLAVQRKITLRQHLYAADMKVAAESSRNGRFGPTRAILERQLPEAGEQDLRGFAWYYLNHVFDQSERTIRNSLTLSGHTGDVYSVNVSPDGKLLASAGKDRTVRLWDADSGHCLRSLLGHTDEVNSVSFAPDGLTIATASDDQTVRVWNVATGEELWALKDFSRPVRRVRFSPDGKVLATADIKQGSSDCATTLWDVSSKTILHRFDGAFILAFCPTDNLIVTFSKDLKVRLINSKTGEVRHAMVGHSELVPSGIFSPDGKRLLTGSENSKLIIWDVETGREVSRFDALDTNLRTIAFSQDGMYLAAGGSLGLVRIWRLPSFSLEHVINVSSTIWSVAFSRDGKGLFVAEADGTIHRCSLAQASAFQVCLPDHKAVVRQVAISSNGNYLATVDGESHAYLWNLHDAVLVRSVAIETNNPAAVFQSVGFLDEGKQLILGDSTGGFHVVETDSGREVAFWQAYNESFYKASLSQDRKVLAVAGASLIKLWNLESHSLMHEYSFAKGAINSHCFSPVGESLVVATGAGTFICHNVDGEEAEIVEVDMKSGNESLACAYSSDGKWFATSRRDRSIKTWNAQSKRAQTTFFGHSEPVLALAFSPDGRTLASGCVNGEIKLWDWQTGQEMFDLPSSIVGINQLTFSQDGQVLVASGGWVDGKGEVVIWHAPQPNKSSSHPLKTENYSP